MHMQQLHVLAPLDAFVNVNMQTYMHAQATAVPRCRAP
jgi:hypothetical protein